MTRTPSQNEIDTDRIKRISTTVADAYEQSNKNERMALLEKVVAEQTKRMDEMDDNLHDGSIEFVKLRNSIDNLTSIIGDIKNNMGRAQSAVLWFLGIGITMGMTFCGSMGWWVIQHYAVATVGK